jgi:hypothetical protein
MANKTFWDQRHRNRNVVEISGVIPLSAAAAVGTVVGRGFSCAKTATGTYTITLEDAYSKLLGAQLTWLEAAASANNAKLVSHDVISAKTVVFKTAPNGSGTATDVAAACEIHFSLKLANSSAF